MSNGVLSERMFAGESKGACTQRSGSASMPPGTSSHFVYILSCSDGTLYVGSTSDLVERERVHNEGRGPKYTAGRTPVRVVYSEAHESRAAAQNREAQLKRWSHAKKQALVDGDRDRLHALAKRRS